MPLGRPGIGVACKDALFFVGGGPDLSFWRSEDDGQFSEEQLTVFGGAAYVTCSRTEALWALIGATAYRFDPQESRWKGVEFMASVEAHGGTVTGVAAHGEDLFVSAERCAGGITIQRIQPGRDIISVDGSLRGGKSSQDC